MTEEIFCQIKAIGSTVAAPHNGYSIGELKMVADALLRAERVIENEIARRVSNNIEMGGVSWR